MRDAKDTPLLMPLRVWSPRRLAGHPWGAVLTWYIIAAFATAFEPDPSGLGIEFHWTYILQTQAVELLVRLALPLLLLFFRPSLGVSGIVRLSLSACVVWLWTTPIAWIWSTPAGGILLAIAREAWWCVVLIAGSGARRPARKLLRALLLPLGTIAGIALSIGAQTVPDLLGAGGIRMDDIGTGRISKGAPDLPPGFVTSARWTLEGSDRVLQPERLALGQRQRVTGSASGRLEVVVSIGSVPPPPDTSGCGTPDPSEGSTLDRLLAAIPAQIPDSVKLLLLHQRVHGSIRYDRKYFPGTSEEILARGTGDCKAYAHLMTEGARRLGFRAKEVRGVLASTDGYYAHAWTTIELDGRWTDWDPTSSIPFPDARYLRFGTPQRATGAFDGELGIFTLQRIGFQSLGSTP